MKPTADEQQIDNQKLHKGGVVEVIDLHKELNGKKVLDGVNLKIESGQVVVILGVSGVGKTVLLKHMNGLMKTDRGRVLFDGEDIMQMDELELDRVRKRIGMVFQFGALINSITVHENVALGLKENRMYPQEKIDRIVDEKLEMVEMLDAAELFPPSLSGGMKKRVAFARAIATEPDLILYDEPSTGLDPITSEHIEEIIININKKLKSTSVVVTHDIRCAFNIADMVAILHNGEVLEYCPPDCIRESKNEFVQRFLKRHMSELSKGR